MITRFAPSLTGYLHLGHVLHMLYVWGIAHAKGAHVLFRIEDHDRGRARAEYEMAILENMIWLGFVPDIGTIGSPSEYRQSDCAEHYEKTLQTLEDQGLVYGCACSRKEILARQPDGANELCYSGTCSEKGLPLEGNTVRFRVKPGAVDFTDLAMGACHQAPREQCGDFSLRDRSGQWTYQFCCVCDDIRHGIDLVVRGEDLLASTGRQIQLFQALEATPPAYHHHPLLYDTHREKLSKRQRSESISQLREAGATPEAIIGLALHAAHLIPSPRPTPLDTALERVV